VSTTATQPTTRTLAFRRLVVVIPVLNPDAGLPRLVEQLTADGFERLVVVNDGSDRGSRPVFDELGKNPRVTLLRHPVNAGKGRALKTAFEYVVRRCPDVAGVITVDADGQHAAEDARRVAEALLQGPDRMVLGARSFGAAVPLRNRLGNVVSRHLFRLLVGQRISDTQTGLRAIPAALLPELIRLAGERYDYETSVLVSAVQRALPLLEVPVRTIYGEAARRSHFDPIRDSCLISLVLARHMASSMRG